jgi:hypothetical protein
MAFSRRSFEAWKRASSPQLRFIVRSSNASCGGSKAKRALSCTCRRPRRRFDCAGSVPGGRPKGVPRIGKGWGDILFLRRGPLPPGGHSLLASAQGGPRRFLALCDKCATSRAFLPLPHQLSDFDCRAFICAGFRCSSDAQRSAEKSIKRQPAVWQFFEA